MARELKYSTPSTDLEALKRELASQPSDEGADRGRSSEQSDEHDYEDDYRRG